MRCYFMRDGRIVAVELLNQETDEGRIDEAHKLFEAKGRPLGVEGFEVWDGPRFVFRFPSDLKTPKPKTPL
jgi:hypothetical protein